MRARFSPIARLWCPTTSDVSPVCPNPPVERTRARCSDGVCWLNDGRKGRRLGAAGCEDAPLADASSPTPTMRGVRPLRYVAASNPSEPQGQLLGCPRLPVTRPVGYLRQARSSAHGSSRGSAMLRWPSRASAAHSLLCPRREASGEQGGVWCEASDAATGDIRQRLGVAWE